jgi:hypothetical protein
MPFLNVVIPFVLGFLCCLLFALRYRKIYRKDIDAIASRVSSYFGAIARDGAHLLDRMDALDKRVDALEKQIETLKQTTQSDLPDWLRDVL